jgi:hypothetical protein
MSRVNLQNQQNAASVQGSPVSTGKLRRVHSASATTDVSTGSFGARASNLSTLSSVPAWCGVQPQNMLAAGSSVGNRSLVVSLTKSDKAHKCVMPSFRALSLPYRVSQRSDTLINFLISNKCVLKNPIAAYYRRPHGQLERQTRGQCTWLF